MPPIEWKTTVLVEYIDKQERLWADIVDAQADLRL